MALLDDFSKGGVHETDGFCWMIFQRGEGTQNRWVLINDFSKGGVHKTGGLLMGFGMFFSASRN